ncbi:MAG: GNAT family N-acetyltransferase [Dokdonella sp.]
MQTELLVRDAATTDITFLADSNAAMALETERKRLDRDTLQNGVRGIFTQPQRGFYLIAQRGSQAVGCLLVTREWSDWRNGDWWWLQSVYVVPAERRRGVFRALHAEVERRAREGFDVIGLRLYVEKDNRAAQMTYATVGLVKTQYQLLEKAGLREEPAT